MPTKRKSIARLVDDAAVILQRIVRMKAADPDGMCECVTCGVRQHWKEMHGGHWIPRNHTIHKLTEENVNPQCVGCNVYHSESAKTSYTLHMVDTYGRDWVDQMEATKREVKKWSRPEIMEHIEYLKGYEKFIRAEKGL